MYLKRFRCRARIMGNFLTLILMEGHRCLNGSPSSLADGAPLTFSGLPVCCDTARSSTCARCITSPCRWSPCGGRRRRHTRVTSHALPNSRNNVTWDSAWWTCSAPHLPTDPGSPRLYCSPATTVDTFWCLREHVPAIQPRLTHSFAVEAARLIGQGSLENLVNPRLLRLLCAAFFSSVLHRSPILWLLLALLLLEQVCNGVEEVVEKFMGILLHVVVKELWGENKHIPFVFFSDSCVTTTCFAGHTMRDVYAQAGVEADLSAAGGRESPVWRHRGEERSPSSQINRFRLSRLLRRKSRVCVSVTSSSSCGITTHRFLSLAVKWISWEGWRPLSSSAWRCC